MLKAIPQPSPIGPSEHTRALAARAHERGAAAGRLLPSRVDWVAALLRDDDHTVSGYLISRICKDVPSLRAAVDAVEHRGDPAALEPAPNFLLDDAMQVAVELGHSYIGCEHVLLALSRESSALGDALRSAQLTWDQIQRTFDEIEWGPAPST